MDSTTSYDNLPVELSAQEDEAQAEVAEAPPRLRYSDVIVFVSSCCIMILELVAGRIIAPYVGVSLYTWTSVIGVVLAGISLGNYVGGWLADRRASLRLLGLIFVLAGLLALGILAVDPLHGVVPNDWPIIGKILTYIVALFFVPCVALGMISPIVAKLAVSDLARTGRTIGRIYGAGTVGSIVGTFATGFFLISWLGTHVIVWGVAIVLLGLGALFMLRRRWPWLVVALLVLAGATLGVRYARWLRGPCTVETNYFCIKLYDTEKDGEEVRVLILDRLVHSYTSLEDPTQLVYGYEKMYEELTAYRAQEDDQLAALFIGGGGYTFPRYMEAVYPNSDIRVLEIDPGVTQVAHDYLGLPTDTRVVTHNQDARLYLTEEPHRHYDLVMGDAFNDFSVPYHLTTKEFNDRVHAWLAEDGLYFVNLVDGPRAEFLRSYVHTLQQTFEHVYVAPTVSTWRNSPRSTFVVVGSDRELDIEALQRAGGTDSDALLARQLLEDDEVEALLDEGRVVMLTDRYAPVDQMLAPVVREEVPE